MSVHQTKYLAGKFSWPINYLSYLMIKKLIFKRFKEIGHTKQSTFSQGQSELLWSKMIKCFIDIFYFRVSLISTDWTLEWCPTAVTGEVIITFSTDSSIFARILSALASTAN